MSENIDQYSENSVCANCGAKDSAEGKCLVFLTKQPEQPKHDDCLFRCSECGEASITGIRCVQEIIIMLDSRIPTDNVPNIEPDVYELIGRTILNHRMAEYLLWTMLPDYMRTKHPSWTNDIERLNKAATEGKLHRRIASLVRQLWNLHQSHTWHRNALTHGNLFLRGSTEFTVPPSSSATNKRDRERTLPPILVNKGKDGEDLSIELTVDALSPIREVSEQVLRKVQEIKEVLRLIQPV